MSSTDYDANIFFLKKRLLLYWRHILWHQNSHLGNKTATSLECNVLASWWGPFKLQHCDRSNLMMIPKQLSLRLGWKFIKVMFDPSPLYIKHFCAIMDDSVNIHFQEALIENGVSSEEEVKELSDIFDRISSMESENPASSQVSQSNVTTKLALTLPQNLL